MLIISWMIAVAIFHLLSRPTLEPSFSRLSSARHYFIVFNIFIFIRFMLMSGNRVTHHPFIFFSLPPSASLHGVRRLLSSYRRLLYHACHSRPPDSMPKKLILSFASPKNFTWKRNMKKPSERASLYVMIAAKSTFFIFLALDKQHRMSMIETHRKLTWFEMLSCMSEIVDFSFQFFSGWKMLKGGGNFAKSAV